MRALQPVSIFLALSIATAAAAGEIDGSMPVTCKVDNARDCHPTETVCGPLKPDTNIEPVYSIDFAKKEVRSPYRRALLPVANTSTNKDSLVLQGADLAFAYSAVIDRETGALTVVVADSEGAYVAFGQCSVAVAK